MKATEIFLISLFIVSAGCVSVKLSTAEDDTKRAQGVTYSTPPSPFVKTNSADVDASWQNGKNGNVISYLSDCKDPSDPPLDSIVSSAVAGLNDLKFESRENVDIQGREGRRVLASGKVDGVASLIDMMVFKRNHCIYILTYAGVKEAFPSNRETFNKFIQGFRAP